MRIAVAAATGNTGSAVVQALAETGRHHILALTRDPTSKAAKDLAALPGVEAVKVEDAFKEPVDRLYLTSAVTRDQFLVETDLIIAARKAGVKYIVKLATVDAWMEVYCEAFYPRSHLAVELFLERGDIPFTCLRANLFHNFVPGLDLDSARKTHQYRSILHGASVACIDPADVGRAAAALLDLDDPSAHYGKKYMLTGPEDVNDQRFASPHFPSHCLEFSYRAISVTHRHRSIAQHWRGARGGAPGRRSVRRSYNGRRVL
jgi:uncharacterized protein YbjT (DUF2867 family)